MGLSWDEAVAAVTQPGARFETIEAEIGGRRQRVYKNAPTSLRALFEGSRAYGDGTFLDVSQASGTADRLHGHAAEDEGHHRADQHRAQHHRVEQGNIEVSDEIRQAINQHRDSTEIASIACSQGMTLLQQDGQDKVAQGITSAAEVARVCQAV